MPRCPFCDHENPAGVSLCPSCGADLLTSLGSIQGLEDLRQQVSALLSEGQKIEAIKLYRERTGVGLKEAKDAVEAIQRGKQPQDLAGSDNPFHQTLVSLLKQGRKIEAIKVFREVTGSGLKESKAVIESIAEKHGISGSQGTGCLGVIVLAVVIVLSGFALRSGRLPAGCSSHEMVFNS
jgi:ribosomal protein L7/L12